MPRGERQFSTGAFARYFGIRKDTLLYYDSIGLFRPAGVRPNGYRYYTAAQLRPFGTLLSLREMNVPIRQVRRYFESHGPDGLVAMAREQMARIDEEMARLAATRALFAQVAADTQEALEAPLEQVQIRRLAQAWFFYGAPNPAPGPTDDAAWMDLLEQFMKQTGAPGAAPVGALLARADLERGQFSRVERLFLPVGPGRGTCRPAGDFAVFYYKGSYDGLAGAYGRMLAQVAAARWQPCGDAWEEYLIADLAAADPARFVTRLTLPVRRGARDGE